MVFSKGGKRSNTRKARSRNRTLSRRRLTRNRTLSRRRLSRKPTLAQRRAVCRRSRGRRLLKRIGGKDHICEICFLDSERGSRSYKTFRIQDTINFFQLRKQLADAFSVPAMECVILPDISGTDYEPKPPKASAAILSACVVSAKPEYLKTLGVVLRRQSSSTWSKPSQSECQTVENYQIGGVGSVQEITGDEKAKAKTLLEQGIKVQKYSTRDSSQLKPRLFRLKPGQPDVLQIGPRLMSLTSWSASTKVIAEVNSVEEVTKENNSDLSIKPFDKDRVLLHIPGSGAAASAVRDRIVELIQITCARRA
jgi:hypothetical protein